MNLKRFCSFVLCICYLSLSVASLTWADTASSSNSENDIMMLSTNVGYTFNAYSDGQLVSSGSSAPAWSKNFLMRFTSTGSYFECGSGLHIKAKISNPWAVSSCQLQIRYTSGVTKYVNAEFSDLFTVLSGGWAELHLPVMFEGQVNQIGILISGTGGVTMLSSLSIQTDNAPSGLSLSGLYKGANNVLLARVYFPIGIGVIPYHDIYPFYSEPKNYMQIGLTGSPVDGVYFERGFEYNVSFKSGILMNRAVVSYNGVLYNVSNFNQDSGLLTFTFESPARMTADEVYFFLYPEKSTQFYPVRLIDVGSNYVPSDQSGSVSAGNTTIIKNVVTNISNTVSNISNQITNTTNTITNTITNTTNQIKEAVNQSANQISQTVTNTSNQIKDSVNQSAEKISQTVTNKVNEVNGTINSVGKETQKKIDDMQKAVVDKLEDTKTGIITGIIDGLKSLFIPSDDFFKTWFDDMYSFFDERLGFLMLPVDLLVNLIDIVVSADSSNAGIPFPEIQWEGTVLIPAQTVRIEIFDTEFGKDLQDKLYFVGNVIMIGALLLLMYRKFEEVLRS